MTDPSRVVAIVLAAGAATRFGGAKLTAPLDGRPLVAHVLDAARAAGIGAIVLVTGADADVVRVAAGPMTSPGHHVVHNPDWASGLASSVRAGLAAAAQALPAAEAALLLLGDQPRVRLTTVTALLAAAAEPGRPIVAPRYAAGSGHNPVLLRRSAWTLADALGGDRGLGPLIAASPGLVTWVGIEGDNPDVDTIADLRRLEERERT